MATQLEIAEKLGISDRWLRKLVEAGAIKDAGRNAWDLATVARELLAYRELEIDRLKAENASLQAQLQRSEGTSVVKADEDTRLAKAKADKAEMEVAEMRGQLIPTEQISDALHGAVVIMKTRLAGIPAKAAPLAHAAPSVAAAEKLIRDQVDEALAELGNVAIVATAPAVAA